MRIYQLQLTQYMADKGKETSYSIEDIMKPFGLIHNAKFFSKAY